MLLRLRASITPKKKKKRPVLILRLHNGAPTSPLTLQHDGANQQMLLGEISGQWGSERFFGLATLSVSGWGRAVPGEPGGKFSGAIINYLAKR